MCFLGSDTISWYAMHTNQKPSAGIICARGNQGKSHPFVPCPRQLCLLLSCFHRQLAWVYSVGHVLTEIRVDGTLWGHLFPNFSPAIASDVVLMDFAHFCSTYCWIRRNAARGLREVIIPSAQPWWGHHWNFRHTSKVMKSLPNPPSWMLIKCLGTICRPHGGYL